MRTPTIYEAIDGAERLGEIARFGFPASVRRHFGQLEGFPRGFLPFGDALCRFNPVYGQGMSVAAQEASLLHALLQGRAEETDPLAGLASAFFAEADTVIETPWAQAVVPADQGVPVQCRSFERLRRIRCRTRQAGGCERSNPSLWTRTVCVCPRHWRTRVVPAFSTRPGSTAAPARLCRRRRNARLGPPWACSCSS